MAGWPARPNTLATRSSPDLRAPIWLSEWDEIDTTIAPPRLLDRGEIPVDSAQLARFLIGKMLVLVLAEGVAAGDPAGRAYRGITPRNRALFLERGHAYVYLAYGSSFMLNVSSETSGVGTGVLIRAIEPTDGITIMERTRGSVSIGAATPSFSPIGQERSSAGIARLRSCSASPPRRRSGRASISSFPCICAPRTGTASMQRWRTAPLSLMGRPTLTRGQHKTGRKLYVEMTFALVIAGGAAKVPPWSRAMSPIASYASGRRRRNRGPCGSNAGSS